TKDAKKIELDLIEIFEKKDWVNLTHMIIDHGRAVCIARRPQCSECVLTDLCPSSLAI
ncbi:MAG: endonuclease III, partial [Candidatus Marinimicrobia bacterium]|nr:endonuclease III [Candidatus Neomarinimicrobiota bacterium]MBT7946002.1 endonuclease III [Candidatus Neomarinimicrobiota bacterium]